MHIMEFVSHAATPENAFRQVAGDMQKYLREYTGTKVICVSHSIEKTTKGFMACALMTYNNEFDVS